MKSHEISGERDLKDILKDLLTRKANKTKQEIEDLQSTLNNPEAINQDILLKQKKLLEFETAIKKIDLQPLKKKIDDLIWNFDLNHQQQSIHERKALFSLQESLSKEYSLDDYLAYINKIIKKLSSEDQKSSLIKKLTDLIDTIPHPTNTPVDESKEQKDNDSDEVLDEEKYQKLLKMLFGIAGYKNSDGPEMKYYPNNQDPKLQKKLGEHFLKNLGLYLLHEIDRQIKAEQANSSNMSESKSSIRFVIRQLEMVQLHLDNIRKGEPLSLENIEKTQQLMKMAYDRKIYDQNTKDAFVQNLLTTALILSSIALVVIGALVIPTLSAFALNFFIWNASTLVNTGAVLIPLALAGVPLVGVYFAKTKAENFSAAARTTSLGFFASSLKEAAKSKAAEVPALG